MDRTKHLQTPQTLAAPQSWATGASRVLGGRHKQSMTWGGFPQQPAGGGWGGEFLSGQPPTERGTSPAASSGSAGTCHQRSLFQGDTPCNLLARALAVGGGHQRSWGGYKRECAPLYSPYTLPMSSIIHCNFIGLNKDILHKENSWSPR